MKKNKTLTSTRPSIIEVERLSKQAKRKGTNTKWKLESTIAKSKPIKTLKNIKEYSLKLIQVKHTKCFNADTKVHITAQI